MEKVYYKRIMDNILDKRLNFIEAILIVGPKWCGKTTTAEKHAKSIIRLQDEEDEMYESYLNVSEVKPSQLLQGEKPRLIDEWQTIPKLWDAVRSSVDKIGEQGLYILTGSTTVDESKIKHSSTGRIHRLIMRPMSLFESKDSNGKISLLKLFDSPNLDIDGIESNLNIDELIFVACRGGWPSTLNMKSKEAQLFVATNYVDNICNSDASSIDGIKRDPDKVLTILQSYARNISTLASNKTIMKDIHGTYEDISQGTFYSYVDALKRLFVIDDLPAWSPNIRSATVIRQKRKKEFIDPSIAVASLGLTPEMLLKDFKTFGFIFENLCIRDLKVYTTPIGARLSYYHDRYGLEANCVIHLRDGRYALFEFKLGSSKIKEGANHLLKLDKLIKEHIKNDNLTINEPSFLAIITGGKYAYTRKDGVKVIPIGCLKD